MDISELPVCWQAALQSEFEAPYFESCEVSSAANAKRQLSFHQQQMSSMR